MIRSPLFAALACGLIASSVGTPAAAQTILSEGFEGTGGATYTGSVTSLPGAPDWELNLGRSGRLRLSAGPAFVASGSYAATLDRNPNGTFTANTLTLNIDLSAYTNADQLYLDFSYMDHGEEAHAGDRVWVRGSVQDPWLEVYDLTTPSTPNGVYQNVTEIDLTAAFLGAGQVPSTSAQIRFGQEDNFPATTTTASDGITFDDIEVWRLADDELTMSAILSPVDGDCGGSAQMIDVEVANLGSLSQSSVPVTVDVSGDITASFSGTVVGPLAGGATEIVSVGPIDTYSGATITIDATVFLPGDADPSNDSLTESMLIESQEVVVNTPADVCPGSTALLSVVPEAGVDYAWYDVATGGVELATGDTFTTPGVTALTSYWVQQEGSSENVGPTSNSIGNGGYYNVTSEGVTFDVTTETTLASVVVYPSGPGDVVVNLQDSAGNLLDTATVAVSPPAAGAAETIPLGFTLPPGTDYQLNAAGTSTGGLYRNTSGATYPYVASSGDITLSSPNVGSPTFHYFFYDWTIGSFPCNDERTEIVVDVDPAVCVADVEVVKSEPFSDVVAGLEATWTLDVTNNGPDLANNVVVDDPTPMGLTFVSASSPCAGGFPCALGQMIAGTSESIEVTFSVPADWDPTVPITNVGSVSADEPDTDSANDTSTTSSTVVRESDIVMTVVDAPDPLLAGVTLDYSIDLVNNGPSDAADVVVTTTLDALLGESSTIGCFEDPTGIPTCPYGTLAVLETGNVEVSVAVPPEVPPGIVTSTFEVASGALEVFADDNTVSVETTVDAGVDLVVTVEDAPDPALPEAAFGYAVDVTNNGPSLARNVVLEISFPADATLTSAMPDACSGDGSVTCTWAELAPAATEALTFDFQAPEEDAVLSATFTATSDATELSAGDESVTEETVIAANADLTLTASVDPTTVIAGGTVALTAEATNNGPSTARAIDAVITLPEGVSLGANSPCTEDGENVRCALGDLTDGASVALGLVLDIDAATSGTVSMTVGLESTTPETAPGDETVVLELVVEVMPNDDGDGENAQDGCACSSSGLDGDSPVGVMALFGVLGLALRRRRT